MTTSERVEAVAIELKAIYKAYTLYASAGGAMLARSGALKLIPQGLRPTSTVHRAVDGIDLTIRRGERVGVVGRNGAGKTTLLKLVIGAIQASSGEVRVNGRIQSLMQTGLGFSPDQSGWENIRSALTLAGIPATDVDGVREEIAEFVELGDFLKQPFRTYSAGMSARLQFATATALNPEILVIDEVLGAGDTYFMLKCMKRMEELASNGCTLLLVTHATQQILHFCERAVWIERGKVIMDNSALDVTSAYDVFIQRLLLHAGSDGVDSPAASASSALTPEALGDRLQNGALVYRWPSAEPLRVVDVSLNGRSTNQVSIQSGQRLLIEFSLECPLERMYLCRYLLTFWTATGERVARLENELDRFSIGPGREHAVRSEVPTLELISGLYLITLSIYDFTDRGFGVPAGGHRVDFVVRAAQIQIQATSEAEFVIRQPIHLTRACEPGRRKAVS